ncbi:MAG: YdiU family protein, partial [Candidatus Omnitrophica bacterium]|nr:YdiU family protein [Candidatus Omnitrophota bacterium]
MPNYNKFDKIDGTHPWREVSEDGYIDYPAMYRPGGKVLYFNYSLAKDLELIPKNHPHKMNLALEKKILKAFSIQILNEFDWQNKETFPRDGLESRVYMATKYLQAQHKDKKGTFSGDGRSIWNGVIQTKDMTFDISSRGTGATILSPGAQEAQAIVETGDESLGYASGLADLDEMLASAIMSEIFYQQGIPTERCLTVIDFEDGSAIGVRSAPNLIRPAHLFRYLKQDKKEELEKSFEYFLHRQRENGHWPISKKRPHKYKDALKMLTKTYARLAAMLEEDYIFNWLCWDGDNLLATGAILDYGSIRQFAAKHDKYRYEDVDRFSTSLTEQKREARNIVKTFVQAVDFILEGEKKSLKEFDDDEHLQMFNDHFQLEATKRFLTRVGFTEEESQKLTKSDPSLVEDFRHSLDYFEDIKTVKGPKKVPDGVDHPPVFLVRHLLRDYPEYLLKNYTEGQWPTMPAEEFCGMMAASYANKEDLKITDYRVKKSTECQGLYRQLLLAVNPKDPLEVLKSVAKRAAVYNYIYRSTGDGLTWVVQETIANRNKLRRQDLQDVIERFIESQVLVPEKWKPISKKEISASSTKAQLL